MRLLDSTRNDIEPTMAALRLTPDEFHGEWNYAIAPAEPAQLRKQPRKLRAKL